MAWPWPLDGVEKWFQDLWNWVSKAAVNAVSVVSKWIGDAVAGLWKDVSGAFTAAGKALSGAVSGLWKDVSEAFSAAGKVLSGAFDSLWVNIVKGFSSLWDSISSSVDGLLTSISDGFSNLWTSASGVIDGLWTNTVAFFGNLWDSISAGLSGLWTSISGAVDSAVTSIGSGLSSLWTGIVDTVGNLWNSISSGISAVGNAIGGAVNTIGNWVSDALKGVGDAMGKALQGFVDWFWKGLQTAGAVIVGAVSEYAVKPLLGALDWIRNAIFGILSSLWSSITGFFGGHSPITPEEAAGWTVPLLLISSGAGFGVSVMGAIGELHVMGSGLKASAITDFVKDAFAMGDVSRSLIMPIFNAAYQQPIQYYYNSVYRPRIPDTRTADQMLFEENIAEPEWRQIYRYNGWKEQHIDAWFKTMWREPSLLVLRNLVLDPDVDEAWVRRKMREGGLIGEDADAIIAYGKRQSLKDERSAMATQVQTDLIDGVIVEADARADLQALKFTPGEIDYRIARCTLIVARNERRAVLKAVKNFTEADLKAEVALGLRTRDQFVADMDTIGFSAAIAQRKYVLITTSKPLSAAEIDARKIVVQNKIVKATRRFDMLIARHDLQTGLIADMIDYLSSLEKPPDVRIASLILQLNKAADEKALILEERDAELADFQAELSLTQAG